jgi:flagellin
MSISNNLNALSSLNSANYSARQMNNSSASLASGSRINRAADDAAGLAISKKMEAEIGGTGQAIRNANDGVSMVQLADGALEGINGMLGRLQMLAVQSANGTLNNSQRGFLQNEANQILGEINRIARTTNFNDINLLDGSLAGGDGVVLHVGAKSGDTVNVNINAMFTSAIGLDGFDISTASGARSALNSISGAMDFISAQRASLGATQNRLEYTINSLTTSNENLLAANSRIADADMAAAAIEHTKNQLMQQVSLAMLAHDIQEPQGMLSMLNQGMTSFMA